MTYGLRWCKFTYDGCLVEDGEHKNISDLCSDIIKADAIEGITFSDEEKLDIFNLDLEVIVSNITLGDVSIKNGTLWMRDDFR